MFEKTWHWRQLTVASAWSVFRCGLAGAIPTPGTVLPASAWQDVQAAPRGACGITGGAPE
jgi:hypothetical protein